jgi:hypothetical protein
MWTNNIVARQRRRAPYGGTVGRTFPGPTDVAANEKFLTVFSKAGSNIIGSAATVMGSSQRPECWAELVKRMTGPDGDRILVTVVA